MISAFQKHWKMTKYSNCDLVPGQSFSVFEAFPSLRNFGEVCTKKHKSE
ncbi:Uncharacterized protein dnm_064510 [Desulfonema magnum]|uniref:Uncharacterized protein n=1 Tax=Desulfonema magnum TaxID=45655 RepID=A0A975GQY4_9BACT|nr:Uncharacterized protein dnm_064510 [Desulfonema magnum]